MTEENSLKFYKESGIANPINLALSFFCSFILIIPISYLYSLIITYLPIVYFNVILVIIYGYSIALISNFFNEIFKIRNRKKAIIFTIASSFLAFYCQWISYIYIVSSEEIILYFEPQIYFEIFSQPLILFENIFIINEFGYWEMFSMLFKGSVLWIIWAFEFIIILTTTYFGISKIKIRPFSENDNDWFKKNVFEMDFDSIKLRKDFTEEYKKNPFKAINELGRGNGIRYSKIYIYSSKSDTKKMLSIENVMITERGSGTKDIEEIISPNYIDNIYIAQLKKEFKIKKSSFFNFLTDLYS